MTRPRPIDERTWFWDRLEMLARLAALGELLRHEGLWDDYVRRFPEMGSWYHPDGRVRLDDTVPGRDGTTGP